MSAMPFNSLFVLGGVLLVITLLFVGLLALPGKGRGWRIGLLCLLILTLGGVTLLGRVGMQRSALQGQELVRLTELKATAKAAKEEYLSRRTALILEDGQVVQSTVIETPCPGPLGEIPSPDTAPGVETCPDYVQQVGLSRPPHRPREHRRPISGAASVLGILGVLFAATVVLKIATRHNARPRQA